MANKAVFFFKMGASSVTKDRKSTDGFGVRKARNISVKFHLNLQNPIFDLLILAYIKPFLQYDNGNIP
jgi:hypothetical protein